VRTGPEYWSARFNLATELAKAGKVDKGVDNLRIELAANPGDAATMRRLAEALTLRGILLLRDGKREEAVAQFDEALKFNPSNEDARMNREQAMGR
jgi:tetratricopeptide (TPR) repeat protein